MQRTSEIASLVAAACAVTVASSLGATALASPPARAAASRTIVLKNIAFEPGNLRVTRGSRVTFRWQDGVTAHNVHSRGSRKFKGSAIKSRGTHTVRLARAGTYRYVCTLHLGMSGRITVK